MIPVKFMSKIDVYDIQNHGVTLKVRVAHADDNAVLELGITELRSQFGTTVVGLMVQPQSPFDRNKKHLQLCVGTRCLMYEIPDNLAQRPIPKSLVDFLSDPEICFVVAGKADYRFKYKNYVELSEFCARVLKKPGLITYSSERVEALASEVGIKLEENRYYYGSSSSVNLGDKVFTDEQIKHATRDVCACYLIGKKLLGSV
ncbi:hypothetical protein LguiB_006393 [Lonicera macranthoides]